MIGAVIALAVLLVGALLLLRRETYYHEVLRREQLSLNLQLGGAEEFKRLITHEVEVLRAERERCEARLAEAERLAREERYELMERIQRPLVQPMPPDDVGEDNVKLHWSEDDEIQGITPGQVAAAARLSPYIDEIAHQEGVAT